MPDRVAVERDWRTPRMKVLRVLFATPLFVGAMACALAIQRLGGFAAIGMGVLALLLLGLPAAGLTDWGDR